MLQDFVFMKTYVRAAGLFAALPAFQVIGGIYGPAFWTGKVLQHLGVPRFAGTKWGQVLKRQFHIFQDLSPLLTLDGENRLFFGRKIASMATGVLTVS